MDTIELEALAVQTYEQHKFNPCEPESAFALARRIHGPNCIRRVPGLLGSHPAAGYQLGVEQHFALRRTLLEEDANFYLAHELAHVLLGVKHGAGALIESRCDYLAACLMAPRPAVLALFRVFGWDLTEIADQVTATQTWAALRIAEVLREPVATVGPIAVRTRGPEEWVWPDEGALRRLAVRARPGITKIRVTDRPRRVVLRAEAG